MSGPDESSPSARPLENRFHLLALVFQRVRQLRAGARPRVAAEDHKPTRLALLEVMADTVSWTLAEAASPEAALPTAATAVEGP